MSYIYESEFETDISIVQGDEDVDVTVKVTVEYEVSGDDVDATVTSVTDKYTDQDMTDVVSERQMDRFHEIAIDRHFNDGR